MSDDAPVAAGTFSQVIEALNHLRDDGIIHQYAIVGAMAANLWDEPVATQDVDVAVVVAGDPHPLDPLRPLFDWLSRHGFAFDGEHALIAGVPVQFLPEWHPVIAEGIETAAEVQYDPTDPHSPKLRVMRPTYLVASWEIDPAACSPRRRERAARLREAGLVDEPLLADVMARYRK